MFFDGDGDYITVPDNDVLEYENSTISFWVKPILITDTMIIISKRTATTNGFNIMFYGANDALNIDWGGSAKDGILVIPLY